MLRTIALAALVACAAGFEVSAPRPAVSAFAAVRTTPRVAVAVPQPSTRAIVMSDSPSEKESTIAVALTGAFLGVYVLDNVITAAILASLAAYATTTDSKAGELATQTGEVVAKSYKSIVKFSTDNNVLPKAKEVTDKVVAVLNQVNENYQITAKIDEKLLLSEKFEKAGDKISEVTESVSTKVKDFSSSMK